MKVADRVSQMPGIALDVMADMADERSGSYRLENAESDVPPPEYVVQATRDVIGKDEYNSWLPLVGRRELRKAVADRIRRDHALTYDWQTEIVITNGAMEGLLSTMLTLVNAGDCVISPEPAYSGAINRIRLAHGVPQLVPLIESEGWRLDIDALHRAVTDRTKGIVLNATNMPTGKVFTREEIDAIVDLARERDLWVINNSTSGNVVFDGIECHNIATWPGMRERTVTLGGVSKDFNLHSWRVGWAVGDGAVMQHVGKAHMYNGTSAGAFQQAGITAFLENRTAYDAYKQKCIQIFQERRDVITGALTNIPQISFVKPQGGWWFLVDHRKVEPSAEKFAKYLLEEVNVAVTPMTTWGPNTAMGHIRIIFANEPVERLREAGRKIGEAVAKLASQTGFRPSTTPNRSGQVKTDTQLRPFSRRESDEASSGPFRICSEGFRSLSSRLSAVMPTLSTSMSLFY